MSKNLLIDALQSDSKTGYLFHTSSTYSAYKTGFPILDYAMGFNVNVFNKEGKLDYTYPALGITAGSIVTIIGKTHVGKTTLAIQIASNIVRPYPNGTVMHFDLEGGTNLTRISTISRFTPNEMEDGKYILKQTGVSMEEIKVTLSKIYMHKTSNPDIFKHDTGKVDELGNPIMAYEPTCIIIDSVASLTNYINENTKDGVKTLEEISTQTDRMRLTGEIGRFLLESLQMCKAANIILLLINHVKDKPPMGTPQAPEIRGLKQNETMPAGKALQYYTNTLIRLTSIGAEKYVMEEHGFNGFGVQASFIKNRSNVDGSTVHLVYDKQAGYDSVRSSVMYAKDEGVLGGNKNGYYFLDDKDTKFKFIDIHEEFKNNRSLYKIMYKHIVPILEKCLTTINVDEYSIPEEEFDY